MEWEVEEEAEVEASMKVEAKAAMEVEVEVVQATDLIDSTPRPPPRSYTLQSTAPRSRTPVDVQDRGKL